MGPEPPETGDCECFKKSGNPCGAEVLEFFTDDYFRCIQTFTLNREWAKSLVGQDTGRTSWSRNDGKTTSVFCSGSISTNSSGDFL